ncbi:MAG: rod shape-determining protein MreC [Victivallales bacterium]|nr:rod shape-determining protein MreC [Victivallales bacterium]
MALVLLPEGTQKRLQHLGHLVTQPAEEIASLSMRISREALGGLPAGMTLAERDEMLAEQARLHASAQTATARIQALEAENQSLQKLLQHVSVQRNYALVVGEVLKRPGWRESRRTLVIDRGTSSGVQPGQAALTLEGVAGFVTEATARQAVVELVSAPEFALPCEVGGRRLTAVLERQGEWLGLTSILGEDYARAVVGDQVLTTDLGSDAMQPGLLLGTISQLSWDENGAPRYTVAPAATADTLKYLMIVLPERR